MFKSPLNYTGGKYKLLPQILPYFPKHIDTFVDLFCGGCNVGLNVDCKSVIYNDINEKLIDFFNVCKTYDIDSILNNIYRIIHNYDLSLTSKNGYAFYGCNSSQGLGAYNKRGYYKLREDYNDYLRKGFNISQNDKLYNSLFLYVLIVYGFNNQIRFNRKGEFNLPVGKRDFNEQMKEKLENFVCRIHNQSCCFMSSDFKYFNCSKLTRDDFVYIDPPYLITCATYNENDGWNEFREEELLNFLDYLNDLGVRFCLSNVLRSRDKENIFLINWLAANAHQYKVIPLQYSYSNSSYQIRNRESKTEEVLIINY